ncbi:hypothetical protein ACP70R_048101 [Stipagrostis hirtigluma subsp. patula]
MATPAKKVLLLRSAEGKVFVAPTWDPRPGANFLPPMETGVPSRALERFTQFCAKHALATARGNANDLWEWDAEFVRGLAGEEGLLQEVYTAACLFQTKSLSDLIVLFAADANRSAAAAAAHAGRPRADVAAAVDRDRAAASRARGRQRAAAEEDVACHHCKRSVPAEPTTTAATAWSAVGPAPAAPPRCARAASKKRIFSSPARSTASTLSTARSRPPSCLALLQQS